MSAASQATNKMKVQTGHAWYVNLTTGQSNLFFENNVFQSVKCKENWKSTYFFGQIFAQLQ
jgi:hypothetical protein